MAYRWKLVALLFCCAALNYGDRAATASVFPLFRSDLGMTECISRFDPCWQVTNVDTAGGEVGAKVRGGHTREGADAAA